MSDTMYMKIYTIMSTLNVVYNAHMVTRTGLRNGKTVVKSNKHTTAQAETAYPEVCPT
jgi:hypothetical protein